jgi:hypothetical protein
VNRFFIATSSWGSGREKLAGSITLEVSKKWGEGHYDVPFKFTGKIDKLTFKLEPEPKAAAKR